MIYLDNNATTEPLPEVRSAVTCAMSLGPANPMSAHIAGEPARRLIAEARDNVALLIGASPEEILFASSGTEANNLVLHHISQGPKRKLLTTPVEHESILRKAEMLTAQGVACSELPVDHNGVVCLNTAADLITADVGMVSVQWVNHETGVIQPVQQLAALCNRRGVLFHTDAAQAVGKTDVDVERLQADYITFTGHKFRAPMGIGVLYRRQGVPLAPLIGGGMQESGFRAGTHNLAGIAGIGVAADIRRHSLNEIQEKSARLRDAFEMAVLAKCPRACINTDASADRICNTTSVRFPGVDGEALLAQLITAGICCSQGSACTSQLPEPSHTLMAMGLTREEAYQSIRFSFSEINTKNELEQAAEIISARYASMKSMLEKHYYPVNPGSIS